jgi:hypothetical protein
MDEFHSLVAKLTALVTRSMCSFPPEVNISSHFGGIVFRLNVRLKELRFISVVRQNTMRIFGKFTYFRFQVLILNSRVKSLKKVSDRNTLFAAKRAEAEAAPPADYMSPMQRFLQEEQGKSNELKRLNDEQLSNERKASAEAFQKKLALEKAEIELKIAAENAEKERIIVQQIAEQERCAFNSFFCCLHLVYSMCMNMNE